MTLLIALTIAIVAGVGVYLMMRHDIVKLVAGSLLLSNAALLLVMAGTLHTRAAPIAPIEPGELVADPVLSALALTAVVITFGVTVLFLAIVLAVERSHDTIDMDALASAEVEAEPERDRESVEAE